MDPPQRHPRESGEPDDTNETDAAPMAYMTTNDPSPYLFESQVDMLGRASTSTRQALRSRHGRRRKLAIVGLVLILLALASIITGLFVPFITGLATGP